MARYYPTAPGAFPSGLFLFKEFLDAILFDKFEVVDHTHPVMSSVAFIDMAEPLAGKIIALITVFNLAISEQIASLFEEGTVLISWPATGTVRHSDSLASYVMFKSKVSAAYSAVHSARSDQFLVHLI